MQFRDPAGGHRHAGIPVTGRAWKDTRIADDDVAGVIFQDCVFERVRLERANLEQTMFLSCRFDDCTFDDCRIVQTRWIDCVGSGVRVSGGELSEPLLSQTRLSRLELARPGWQVVLSECEIERLEFNGAGCEQDSLTISGCTFGSVLAESARWRNASAVGVDLGLWSLDNASFERCSFIRSIGSGVDFSQVRFESCNMYQSRLCESRLLRAERCLFAECDLSGADFTEANLEGALFAKSNATKARFERACLDVAMFPKAVLTEANFSGAVAVQSVWTEADLTGANLEGMDASRAIFRNAVFRNTEVMNARFVEADLHGVEATLEGADLRDSRGTVDWRAEREAQATAGP